jgi:hypothetical protein
MILSGNPGRIVQLLSNLESHAALTQAVAAVASTLIAAGALIYALLTLKAMQRQTEASTAMMRETFRPVVEVLGGELGERPAPSKVDFENKGNGSALNFRWRVDEVPERWGGYTSNIITPQEKGRIVAPMDWTKGLVLSYNSVANREEIRTYVKFGSTGSVSNHHEVRQGAAVTRLGWTVANPELAVPAWHPALIAAKPWRARVGHWWRLKRGKERRL